MVIIAVVLCIDSNKNIVVIGNQYLRVKIAKPERPHPQPTPKGYKRRVLEQNFEKKPLKVRD